MMRFFKKRVCRVPTVWGWLGLLLGVGLLLMVGTRVIYAYLSPTHPAGGALSMAIEGWLDDDQLEDALDVYRAGKYRHIYTTGGPVPAGSYLLEYESLAAMTAARLRARGVTEECVTAVPAPKVVRGRTLASAMALKAHLSKAPDEMPLALDLVSVGPHTRRSFRAFKQALHPVRVGAIALVPKEYNAETWWTCSEGVRTVIGETLAWCYAVCTGDEG